MPAEMMHTAAWRPAARDYRRSAPSSWRTGGGNVRQFPQGYGRGYAATAANDNSRLAWLREAGARAETRSLAKGFLRQEARFLLGRYALGSAERALVGAALRLTPWAAAALTAYELYQWYQGAPGSSASIAFSTEPDGHCVGDPVDGPNEKFGTAGFGGPCWVGTQFQVPEGDIADLNGTVVIPAFGGYFTPDERSFLAGRSQAQGDRYAIHEHWWWTAPSWVVRPAIEATYVPAVDPMPGYVARPVPLPRALPSVDPFVLPIEVPVPTPSPVPWRLLPRVRPSSERVEQSYRGSEVPSQVPAVDPVAALPPARREPPGPRERERKFTSPGARAIRAIAHSLSEVPDYVEAVYRALPQRRQTAKGTRQQLRQLYRYYREIDMNEAIRNLMWNEIEDRFVGTKFGDVKDAATKQGVTLGPAGSGAIPQWFTH